MRIIGIELRVEGYTRQFGQEQKEVAVIPCDITIEVDPIGEFEGGGAQWYLNGTLHTEQGDITIPRFAIPTPRVRSSAIRNQQK